MSRFRQIFNNIRLSFICNSYIVSSAIRPNRLISTSPLNTTNDTLLTDSDNDVDLFYNNHNVSKTNSLSLACNVSSISSNLNVNTPSKPTTNATRSKLSEVNKKRKGKGRRSYSYEFKLSVVQHKLDTGLSNENIANCDRFNLVGVKRQNPCGKFCLCNVFSS